VDSGTLQNLVVQRSDPRHFLGLLWSFRLNNHVSIFGLRGDMFDYLH